MGPPPMPRKTRHDAENQTDQSASDGARNPLGRHLVLIDGVYERADGDDHERRRLHRPGGVRRVEEALHRLNKSFPTRPPIAAPIASGVAVLKSICEAPEMRERKTEYAVMDRTVQPERKLMVETGNAPSASRTGLMTTPPPIPQIAPMIDEKKQTANTAMYTSVIPYLRDA